MNEICESLLLRRIEQFDEILVLFFVFVSFTFDVSMEKNLAFLGYLKLVSSVGAPIPLLTPLFNITSNFLIIDFSSHDDNILTFVTCNYF